MMNRVKQVKVWALGLALTGAAPLAAQQTTTPPPVQTPPPATQTQTPPAGQTTAPGDLAQLQIPQYVVGQAKPPDTGHPVMNMTVDQAVNTALQNNLDLQVAKLNPQINDYQLQGARAVYRPTITGTVGYNNQQSPSNLTTEGGAVINQNTETYNTTINQALQWWGASASASFNNSRRFTTASTASFNPSFSSSLSFNYTQPILANRAIDSNRTQIQTLEITRQITDIQLKQQVANLIAQVRTAYWNLRQAIEQIEIAKENLAQNEQLVRDNQAKVDVGTLAPLDVMTARVSVAQAQQQVISATSSWQQAELAFKRLLVGGTQDDVYNATINPTDHVDVTQVTPNLQDAITTAMAGTDLAAQKKTLESTQISLDQQRNATLPSLNLQVNYGLQGQGGPKLERTSAIGGDVSQIIPGGYGDALTTLSQNPSWSTQLNFTYPLGMVSAKASLARSQLSFNQSQTNLKVEELTIATSVTTAYLNLQNGYQSWQAATISRQYAEQNAQAEQNKFAVGLSNNYNVLTAFNSLNSARLSELNALISYQKFLIEWERVQAIGK